MLKLGVNIDHVATLRQARKTEYPSLVEAARVCREAGAQGITVHLREDRRHIQDRDVFDLRAIDGLNLNLEMANSPDILAVALRALPDEVCLVPERRRELTTEGGLDVAGQRTALMPTVRALAGAGIRVSLFVAADPAHLDVCAQLGVPVVELHTGAYCDAAGDAARRELDRLIHGAERARTLGLRVNAGHGITVGNLPGILRIPHLDTLNIGHSIVCAAVFSGLRAAVAGMVEAMNGYAGGKSGEPSGVA